MPELMIDPEIADHVDTLIQDVEKTAGKVAVKKAVKCLLDRHPDEVLLMYLDDQLGPWLEKQVRSFKKPDEDPSEITIGTIRNYISRRYPRFAEYAEYHASLAGLDQQGPDVLHEVLISILLKDEDRLFNLYGTKKKDGYREIDYYILRMIKLNCHSMTSPYRYKIRQPHIDSNASTNDLSMHDMGGENFIASYAYQEYSEDDSDPTELVTLRFQIIRDILAGTEFSEKERNVFTWKFLADNPWGKWEGPETKDYLNKTYKSAKKKVVTAVDARREKHQLKVIHEVFTSAGGLEIRLHESEFLMLRQLLSDLQSDQAAIVPPEGSQSPAERLEKRMLTKLAQLIKDHAINNKF